MEKKKSIRLLGLMAAVLLVPIVPFLLFGSVLEPEIEKRLAPTDSFWAENSGWTVVGIIACLVADILLPIPSSNVCTFSGRVLGAFQGTLVSWLGLTASCGIGYFLGYICGWPMVKKLSDEKSLIEMAEQFERRGPFSLAIFRAVPVLAEASVLVAGTLRLSPWKFWPPVVCANLGLAIAYALLGEFAAEHGWFGLAMGIALGLPATFLVAWIVVHRKNRQSLALNPKTDHDD